MSSRLSHVNKKGDANMVDVGSKETSIREAQACATVYLNLETYRLVKENKLSKGDVLTVARIAGISAAKNTFQTIPLCHNVSLSYVQVSISTQDHDHSLYITSIARSQDKTGVEMEALHAVSVAALTVYDMCKAAQKDITINHIKLLSKTKIPLSSLPDTKK